MPAPSPPTNLFLPGPHVQGSKQNLIYIQSFNIQGVMASETVSGSAGYKKCRRKRSRYSKISLKSKLIFFRKVIHQNGNLRDIAKRLGIKYSTAKTLTRNYKAIPEEQNTALVNSLCDQFDKKSRARRRCSYRMIEDQSSTSENLIKAEVEERQGWSNHYKIQIISHSIAQE